MLDVTHVLARIESGDQLASGELLPLVYAELRRLASARMARERADHTLQSTALVHEAYVRLVDVKQPQSWQSRGHFYSAAAEAMRRILVEYARRKAGKQQGGDRGREPLDDGLAEISEDPELVLQVSEALEQLDGRDPQAAELVKLRFFAGLSTTEAAEVLGISRQTAYHHWRYAKAMLGRLFA